MQRHPIIASGSAHAVEVLLGRETWAYADYYAEGLSQFDAQEVAIRGAYNREFYARTFAELAMPPAKLAAHRAEQRAELYAEFGESPYRVGAFGLERRA